MTATARIDQTWPAAAQELRSPGDVQYECQDCGAWVGVVWSNVPAGCTTYRCFDCTVRASGNTTWEASA